MAKRISGYLPILLQLIAPKMGVKLTFGDISTGCAHKGEVTITNSVLQMRDRVKAEILALGLLCHEGLGHIMHTDWKDWDKFVTTHPEGKSLLNIIEDARIEKRSWISYRGVKGMLFDVCDAFMKDGTLALPKGQVPPANALTGGLLHVLRGEFLGQPVDPIGGRKLLADTFGQKLADDVIALALLGAEAETTGIAAGHALSILKLLKMEAEKPQEQPKDQQSGQGDAGQGSPGQSSQGNPNSGKPDQGNPGQDAGQGNPDPAKKQKGKGKGNQPAQPAPAPTPQQTSQNAAQALKDMAQGNVQKTDLGNIIQDVVDQSPQQGGGSTPIYGKIDTRVPTGAVRIPGTAALAASRRMAARLEQLMAARVDDDDRIGYSGELVGNLVSRVKLLDTQVFQEEGEEHDGIDSAVLLLLDGSGSMSEKVEDGITRAELCFNAAWATSAAMSKFRPHGVEMAVWSYGSYLTKFIDFGGWAHQKDKLKQYLHAGGTSTFPACVEGIGELAKKKQKRKHLIVFSDGDLGGNPTEKHLSEARKAGIEVSIIFIGNRTVKPESVSVALKDRVYIVHNIESIVSAMHSCLKPQ